MILCRAILGEKNTEINIKLLGLCGKELNSDSLKEQESRNRKVDPSIYRYIGTGSKRSYPIIVFLNTVNTQTSRKSFAYCSFPFSF